MSKLTHGQQLVLSTLSEHKTRGGEAIGNREIDVELNRRHNRTMSYDALHSILKRLSKRGLVHRDARRPARWSITDPGQTALDAKPV